MRHQRFLFSSFARSTDLPQLHADIAAIAIVGDQAAGDFKLNRLRGLFDEGEEGLLVAPRPKFAAFRLR